MTNINNGILPLDNYIIGILSISYFTFNFDRSLNKATLCKHSLGLRASLYLLLKNDSMLKDHQKLDKTLEYLINNKNPYGEFSKDIHEKLQIADDPLEQHLILEKIVEDGYADVNVPKNRVSGDEYRNNPLYIVSYKGEVFKKNGGYQAEYSLQKRELRTRKILSWLNPVWKILAFIALIGVLIKLGIELFK